MKFVISTLLCSLLLHPSFSQIAINTSGTSPHNSAMLDVTATNKGLLIPRMSQAQRTSITNPAKGLLVFTNEDSTFWYYSGTQWIDLLSSASGHWKRNGNDIYNANNGNVGIGINPPNADALLHVNTGSSLTKGFLVSGSFDGTSSVPNLGSGSRLMFYPGKAAFRAGLASSDSWNNNKIGDYSVALGRWSVASDYACVALGNAAKATGYNSTAIGNATTADGLYATALGNHTTASGRFATAMGHMTIAKGYASTVIGHFNDSLLLSAQTFGDDKTPVFIIGNGDANDNRSNALVVQKNGNMMVGDSLPHDAAQLHVELKNSTTKGFLVAGQYNSLSTVPNLGAGSRMMYFPGKAAFRAGSVSGTQWDNTNVGRYSAALGTNNIANGQAAFAMGFLNSASGDYSVALGQETVASGDFSTSTGWLSKAEGDYSFSAGLFCVTKGANAVAFGILNEAIGYSSATFGSHTYAGAPYAFTSGVRTVGKGFASTVIGMYNDSLLTSNQTSATTATPLFIVGNGNANNDRSNAMVVYKNGDTEIDNLKTLKVGNGSTIVKLQAGEVVAGPNPGPSGFKRFILTFPSAFTGIPKLVATAKNDPAWANVDDTFVVSIRNISSTQVEFNIQRVDNNTGWNQNLRIEWQAWE